MTRVPISGIPAQILSRIKVQLNKRSLDAEAAEELEFHIASQTEENRRAGMPPAEARRKALLDFGGVEQVKEAHREARGFPWLESFWQDLKFGARGLRRNPGFTAVAVLLLALGIGANTAIFSVLDAMMFRDLPVKAPEQLFEFVKVTRSGVRTSRFPYPTFEAFREGRETFLDVFAFTERTMAMRAGGRADRVDMAGVSGEYFTSLGVPARHGRTILASDDSHANPNAIAVLSHGFWQRRFGGDPAVVGMTIRLNEVPVEVVGVMPARFVGVNRMYQPDVFTPMTLMPRLKWSFLDEEESWTIRVFGRLRPGVELAAARAELEGPFHRAIEASRDGSGNWSAPEPERFFSQRIDLHKIRHGTGDLRYVWSDTVNTLALVVVLILLLACANLGGLLMTRGVARARELGIRAAIGAGRGRLVRLLFVESTMLAAAGGAAGLLVAIWLHNLLLSFLTVETDHLAVDFQIDGRVLGFTFAASLVAALLFGVMPALRASDVSVFAVLKGMSPFGSVRRPVRVFLTLQVAISLVLLVVAGLFLRTRQNLYALDAGFDRESVLLATIDAWNAKDRSQEAQAYHQQLTESIEAIPGVAAVALSDNMVFGQGSWQKTIWVDGYEYSAGERQMAAFNIVGPGFFQTVRIPVFEGREFNTSDRTDTPLVAIVNRSMAEKYFPGESPLGKRFGDQGPTSNRKYEIVGVVADSKYGNLREAPRPTVYNALTQSRRSRNTYLAIRTTVPPAMLVPQVRKIAMDIDEGLLVYNLRTLEDQVDRSLARDRMFTIWTSLFGAVALLIVCMGLYGVTAYDVERRTNEIGIRMALGAFPRHVVRLVLSDTIRSISAGATIGVIAALAVAHLIEHRLFDLSPADPTAIAAAVVALFAAGAIACYRPAHKATQVDATQALRHEKTTAPAFTIGAIPQTPPGHGTRRRAQLPRREPDRGEPASRDERRRGTPGGSPRHRWYGAGERSPPGCSGDAVAGVLLAGRQVRLARVGPYDVPLPENEYDSAEQFEAFHQQVLTQVGALPGIESGALVWRLPIWDPVRIRSLTLSSSSAPAEEQSKPAAALNIVGPSYLETVGVKLLQGQSFTGRESPEGALTAVISQTTARRYWPGRDPVGDWLQLEPPLGCQELVGGLGLLWNLIRPISLRFAANARQARIIAGSEVTIMMRE